jgi:hypothetical protein
MTFPLTRRYKANVPATVTTASALSFVDTAYEAETVSSVIYIPSAAVTGAAAGRAFTLYNRGAAGGGTVGIATLTLVSGTDLSDNVPKTITLSTTSANLLLTAGQVLEWESVATGSGIVDPGGLVQVNTTRTQS